MAEWKFPSNDGGQINDINDNGVATFRGTPLKSLAREICQNSLDAAVGDKVIVEFSLFNLPSKDFPGKDYLLSVFKKCLEFWKEKKDPATRDFFNTAIKYLALDQCSFLRISDFNTQGLTGSHKELNTNWINLIKASGSSDKHGTAGGSFGIGKYAPFACSYFSTVFYSTYDINKEKAYQGVSRLVTFRRDDGQKTTGTGYYGDYVNCDNVPVYDQELPLDPSFKRSKEQFGTDIFIAGYKYSKDGWQEELLVSILDGFLGAIWNEKLEVRIDSIVINKASLHTIIEQYSDKLGRYTSNYYKVLTSSDTVWFTDDFWDLGNIRLGVLIGDPDALNHVAMIRQTGMKINDGRKLLNNALFMGVLFIEGDKINEALRVLENPEHTKWEPERAINPSKAKRMLSDLYDLIRTHIEELINTGTDAAVDAAGVGAFLPDEPEDNNEKAKDEIISDKVVDIEVKKVKRKSSHPTKQIGDNSASEESEDKGHFEEGGDDYSWFPESDIPINPPEPIPHDPAHLEAGGNNNMPREIAVKEKQIVYLCLDKNAGKYMLKVVPAQSAKKASVELFLSAETQSYEAPIKNATMIGGSASFDGNTISGFDFVENKELTFSLELDFYDYCSLEVALHAIEE